MVTPFSRYFGDMDNFEIPIELPLDNEGYFDRKCPHQKCGFEFKVLYTDWEEKIVDEIAFCPFCGHKGSPEDFYTEEQVEFAQNVAFGEVQHKLSLVLRDLAFEFNRDAPRGFITMRMDVDSPPVTLPAPADVFEAMTMAFTCDSCGCRFAVVGASYFCPACGHNSAQLMFSQTITKTITIMDRLDSLVSTVEDKDLRSQLRRALVEGELGTLVTAFQRFCETSYTILPEPKGSTRLNAFQNLELGSELWSDAGGRRFEDILGKRKLQQVNRYFQQRHLVAHRDGIVDQRYVDRSGDQDFAVGQRIVIREVDVTAAASILSELGEGMKQDLRKY